MYVRYNKYKKNNKKDRKVYRFNLTLADNTIRLGCRLI